MRFKHLTIPDGWETYWTKYPQGMTILESLFQWVNQVDNMVDNQNKLNDNVEQFRNEIDDFVGRFDDRLQIEVTQTLNDWQNSGFLDVVISEALQWQLTDYVATNEADKLSFNTQLAQTNQQIVTERQRINSFTRLAEGSTTGDAELIDGRVGADNHTYSNIGDAIRGQLNKKISVVDGIIPKEHTTNHIITEAVEYGYFYDSVTGEKTVASNLWWLHPLIKINPNTHYRKSTCQLALYDSTGTFIEYVFFDTLDFTTPPNAYYVGVCSSTDVNMAGLYEYNAYTGVYVKGVNLIKTEQIHDFNNDTLDVVSKDFIKRKNSKNLFNKNATVKGQYVEYSTGVSGANPTSEYAIIPVEGSETYSITTQPNIHIAFFSTQEYSSSSYISGVLNQSTFTTPENAMMMTVSIKDYMADTFQVERGAVATDYVPYEYGLTTNDLNDKTVTIEKLADDLISIIGSKKIVHVGTAQEYTSILRAMKENPEKNVTFIVHSGVYDLVGEYEDYYGSDYFVNYAGYAGSSDPFDRGLWLDDGVRLERQGAVTLVFEYTGGNENVHMRFAPINTSQNNYCDLDIKIGDSCCRYGIHDDFATAEGTNIFKNATYEGTSHLNTFIGSGFGISNTYILESLRFKNSGGINIAYHNNVNAGAKNKLIIKDCYCDGGIRGASYGASTEISEMLVSGTKATAITLVNTDDTGHNIDNIELIEWNNTIG